MSVADKFNQLRNMRKVKPNIRPPHLCLIRLRKGCQASKRKPGGEEEAAPIKRHQVRVFLLIAETFDLNHDLVSSYKTIN